MKFAIVFGTRPEIIKVDPVIKELEKRKIPAVLIHTGQHNLGSLVKDLKIRKPDYVLDLPPESAGKFRGGLLTGIFRAAKWSFVIARQIRRILKKEKPDVLLYQGDTLAIASASIAGRLVPKRPVLGHIEAGLRTHDMFNPFPEEISRWISDKASDLLFAATDESLENLKKERFIRGKIVLAGNTIVDAVFAHEPLAEKIRLDLPKKYIVVFVHRQENVHSREVLENLQKFVSGVKENVIFVEHPTLIQKLSDFGFEKKFREIKGIRFVPFFDYLEFMKVMKNSLCVVTDSGGLQEETCILKVPCIIWRTKTERMEAVRAGSAALVGNDYALALKYVGEIKSRTGFYKKVMSSKNPFGDGTSSKLIVDACLKAALAKNYIGRHN